MVAVMTTVQTETLEVLAQAVRYNRWIFEPFESLIGERVLEIGCGIGTFTRILLERAAHVTALDIVPGYIDIIKSRNIAPPGKSVDPRCLNIFDPANQREKENLGTYDTIVMLNVLEHIPDDLAAVTLLKEMLNPGGHLVLLVPALSFLYSDYDRSIDHHRRYHKNTLTQVLQSAGYQIRDLHYFNVVGILGWWINFCLLKKDDMDLGSVQTFEKLVPMLKAWERLCPPPVGLSLIAIAQA